MDADFRPGMAVLDSEGRKVGALEDVLLDKNGTACYLVVRDSGVFANDAVLPAEAGSASGDEVHLTITQEQVHDAPRFDSIRFGPDAGYSSVSAARFDRKDED